MKNIRILLTDKPSRLHLAYNMDFYISIEPFTQLDIKNYKSFNLYITNDEEINVGDYVYSIRGFVGKFGTFENSYQNECKKIILTTDQDLIDDSVQAIDDEFLEWFIKYPSCEEVNVNKSYSGTYYIAFPYKIIIPKEEPKQEYQSECICDTECRGFVNVKCKKPKQENYLFTTNDGVKIFKGDYYHYISESGKCYENCHALKKYMRKGEITFSTKEKGEEYLKSIKSKQETTLEEAEKEFEKLINGKGLSTKQLLEVAEHYFIVGYEIAKENKYSEEDFKLFAREFYREIKLDNSNLLWEELADKCLEQFKNK